MLQHLDDFGAGATPAADDDVEVVEDVVVEAAAVAEEAVAAEV